MITQSLLVRFILKAHEMGVLDDLEPLPYPETPFCLRFPTTFRYEPGMGQMTPDWGFTLFECDGRFILQWDDNTGNRVIYDGLDQVIFAITKGL